MVADLPAFTSNPPQIHHQETTFCTPFFAKISSKNAVNQRQKNYCKSVPFSGWNFAMLATDRASDRAHAAQVKKWVRRSLEYRGRVWPL